MEITLTAEWRNFKPDVHVLTIAGHVLRVEKMQGWLEVRWEWDIRQQTDRGHVWVTGSATRSEQTAKESAEQALCAVLGVSVGARR